MRFGLVLFILFSWIVSNAVFSYGRAIAQETGDLYQSNSEFITRYKGLLQRNYIYPAVAKKIVAAIDTGLEEGGLDLSAEREVFATNLTAILRSVNGDLHLSVRRLDEEPEELGAVLEKRLKVLNHSREEFAGFDGVRNLGNGVGYLRLSYFRTAGFGMANHYMAILSSADAIIIDLRGNKGGTGEMVNYLASYFFKEPTHTSVTISRDGSRRDEYTLAQVSGEKLPETPLFILVNAKTGSGAEGLAFMMQNQGRAMVIGDTTAGAAHSGGSWYMFGYRVFIPNERHVDPVSGDDWEQKGVKPDTMTASDDALDVALPLAIAAADRFRDVRDNPTRTRFTELDKLITGALINDGDKQAAIDIITGLTSIAVLNEGAVNELGYHYLGQGAWLRAALFFKVNTMMYPESPNAYDSYGESLEASGDLAGAIENFSHAVELAKADPGIRAEIYEPSLARARTALATENEE